MRGELAPAVGLEPTTKRLTDSWHASQKSPFDRHGDRHACQKCPVTIPIERTLCYFCADPDGLEGQRRFTLPINPDPITRRLKR